MAVLQIVRVAYESPDAQEIIAEMNDYYDRVIGSIEMPTIGHWTQNSFGIFIIAKIDNIPAGCAGFQISDSNAELKKMYVRPEYRRRRIATRMLLYLEAHADFQDLHYMSVAVYKDKLPEALAFYTKAGYSRFGICRHNSGYVYLRNAMPHTYLM